MVLSRLLKNEIAATNLLKKINSAEYLALNCTIGYLCGVDVPLKVYV